MASVRRRRVLASAGLLAVVALTAATWVIGTRVQSPQQAAAKAAPPEPSWVTAPVEERVLASTLIARGNVTPEASTSIAGPPVSSDGAAGSGIVTGLFVTAGDTVDNGQRVVEIGGRPVFVFAGASPAYRALRPGMAGPDVAQLQAGLIEGGCDAGTSGTYDDPTKVCVEALYADAGYEVIRGSNSELADLAEARTAVDQARDELSVAEQALAQASAPPDPTELATAERAVTAAHQTLDAARRNQPVAATRAIHDVDTALAELNGLLASSNPSAVAAAPVAPEAGGASEAVGATPSTGGSGGPSGRDAAWFDLVDATHELTETTLTEQAKIADSEAALDVAEQTLVGLVAPPDTSAEQLTIAQQSSSLERAEQQLADLEAVSGAVIPFGEVAFVPSLPGRVASVAATLGAGGDASSGNGLVVVASPELQVSVTVPAPSRSLVRAGSTVELLDEATGETVTGTVETISDQLDTSTPGAAPGYPTVVAAELPTTWSGRNVRATFTTATTDEAVLVVPAAAVSSAADGSARVQVQRDDGTIVPVEVTLGLSADGFIEVAPTGNRDLGDGDRVVVGR